MCYFYINMFYLINCKLFVYLIRRNVLIIFIMLYIFVEDIKYKILEYEVIGIYCFYILNIKLNNLILFLVVSIWFYFYLDIFMFLIFWFDLNIKDY